jgi:hypothetical protein
MAMSPRKTIEELSESIFYAFHAKELYNEDTAELGSVVRQSVKRN